MATRNTHDDELRTWLRTGDPAGGDPGLDAEQAARMRRRVLSATADPAVRRALLPLAGLVAVAVAVLLVWLPRQQTLPTSPADGLGPRAADTNEPRRIQFTTERGTRIVWTLDPDFEL